MAEMKLRLLLNANFRPGDLFLMLTYKDDAPSPAEAKKCLEKFMRNLRAQYKAENLECKYISVTEYKNTRIHHHIVLNSIDPRKVQAAWIYGLVRSESLYGYDFAGLAAYLIKETKKTFKDADSPSRKRWNQSKNLIIPKPIVCVVKAKEWRKKPRSRKGYIIETNSIVNDVNIFGTPYQFYRMVAAKPMKLRI